MLPPQFVGGAHPAPPKMQPGVALHAVRFVVVLGPVHVEGGGAVQPVPLNVHPGVPVQAEEFALLSAEQVDAAGGAQVPTQAVHVPGQVSIEVNPPQVGPPMQPVQRQPSAAPVPVVHAARFCCGGAPQYVVAPDDTEQVPAHRHPSAAPVPVVHVVRF